MPIPIQYRFELADGTREIFDVRLDPATLVRIIPHPRVLPEWTRLSFHQCAHCPFTDDTHPSCSVALNLVDLVKRFDRLASYDRMSATVVTQERVFAKATSAQRAISSLMGLLIATSDCPLTDFFKPMARFHLPFATEDETVYRAFATYLQLQFFRRLEGGAVDFDLTGMRDIYGKIQKLNIGLARRLRSVCVKDGAVNAVVVLDVFAKSMPPAIEKSLKRLRPVFEPVLRHDRFPT